MKPIAEIKQKIESLLRNHNEEYIEIHGRENLLAEGYCRIIDYGESKITFASETKTICIKGEKLRLSHLDNQRLAVEGRIDSVEYL